MTAPERTYADDYAEVIAAAVAEVEAAEDAGSAAADYVADVLDVRYLVDADGTVREVTLIVTVGGPYAEVRCWLGSDGVEVEARDGSDRATRWQYAPALAAEAEALADSWQDAMLAGAR